MYLLLVLQEDYAENYFSIRNPPAVVVMGTKSMDS